jgi:hypothetical protein
VDSESPGKRRFFTLTYERAHARVGGHGVVDVSGVFDGLNYPYFIDQWHLSGTGNELVARRMLPYVEKAVEEARNRRLNKIEEAAPAPGH